MDISLCDLFSGEVERLQHLEKKTLERVRMRVIESGVGKQLDNLLSILGVGTVSALFLPALFRIYSDANRKQLTALAGLDPVFRESGTSVHSEASHQQAGNTLGSQVQPSASPMYRRLREAGKLDKSARAAVARKLLLIAFAIFKSGEPFRSDNGNSRKRLGF